MKPFEHILIVKLDTYGDLVLLEPALRALVTHEKPMKVSVLIQENYVDICELFSDKIHWVTTTLDPHHASYESQTDMFDDLRSRLQQERIDCFVSICANKTWVDYLLKGWFSNSYWVSLDCGTSDAAVVAPLLGHHLVSSDLGHTVEAALELHELEKNRKVVEYLIGPVAEEIPALELSEDRLNSGQTLLAQCGLIENQYVVLACAGSANVTLKQWSASGFATVAAYLASRGLDVLLAGHTSERHEIKAVEERCRELGVVCRSWLGKTGEIAMLAALIRLSRGYVGNDSGPLHLACALEKPVVGIYGGGTWPRFMPCGERSCAIAQPLSCFGCGWSCYWGVPYCIKSISAETVLTAVKSAIFNEGEFMPVVEEQQGISLAYKSFIDQVVMHVRAVQLEKMDLSCQVYSLRKQVIEWNRLYDEQVEKNRSDGEKIKKNKARENNVYITKWLNGLFGRKK